MKRPVGIHFALHHDVLNINGNRPSLLHVLFIIFQTHFSFCKDSFLGEMLPLGYTSGVKICVGALVGAESQEAQVCSFLPALGFHLAMGRREGFLSHTVWLIN